MYKNLINLIKIYPTKLEHIPRKLEKHTVFHEHPLILRLATEYTSIVLDSHESLRSWYCSAHFKMRTQTQKC